MANVLYAWTHDSMIIHQPQIQIFDGEVRVSARIDTDSSIEHLPSTLCYCFPERFAALVSDRSDGFISALLLLAMTTHEDIEVYGKVSPQLAYGLEEYQRVFQGWFPGIFQRVKVNYHQLTPIGVDDAGEKVVLSFSGGIDSTYTLMQHIPPMLRLPDFRVTHGLFNHGLDIPLGEKEYYQRTVSVFSDVLKSLGVEVVPCRTNVRAFACGKIPWSYVHGSALISPSLVMTKLIRKYLIASSWSLKKYVPWGSSPYADHLFSTETTEIIHHGLPYTRMDKTVMISQWEPARKYLRVCNNTHLTVDKLNCGVCGKCLRSMIMLQAIGDLERFQSFDRPIKIWDYFRWIPGYTMHVPQIVKYLWLKKKFLSIPIFIIPYLTGWARYLVDKYTPSVIRGRVKKRFYSLDKDPFCYQNIPESFK